MAAKSHKRPAKADPRLALYPKLYNALHEEFEHRCAENKDQRRINELDRLLVKAENALYHWKD